MNVVKVDENNNQIIGANPILENSRLYFKGSNNRLICEENVRLNNSVLGFNGSNSIIYLSSNRHTYYLNISIFNNSVFYIDENNYMNGRINCALSEEKNIFIGKDGLFSFGIWLRLADPHLIYDTETLKRINLTKSIYLGDHVWVGQDALILKGTHVGSGSIIAAKSAVSNKKISSNSLWGGVPARKLRDNVLFDGSSVHAYTENETKNSLDYKSDNWIYKNEGEILSFNFIDEKLNEIDDVEKKINLLQKIRDCKSYNRFFV